MGETQICLILQPATAAGKGGTPGCPTQTKWAAKNELSVCFRCLEAPRFWLFVWCFCLAFCSENSIKEMKLRVYPTCAILIICVRSLTTALFSQGKKLYERSHEVPATSTSGSPYRHLYIFSVVQELYIHFGEQNLRVAEMYQIRFVLFRYMRLLC